MHETVVAQASAQNTSSVEAFAQQVKEHAFALANPKVGTTFRQFLRDLSRVFRGPNEQHAPVDREDG